MKVLSFQTKAEWLAARKGRITSSTGPIVAGYKKGSPFLLNRQLRGLVPESKPGVSDDALEWGKRLEPVIRQTLFERDLALYSQEQPWPSWVLCVHDEYPWLGDSPDGLLGSTVRPGFGVLEMKTTAALHEFKWLGRGETITIPDYPWCQIQHHMLVTGANWGVIAVLIGMGFQTKFRYGYVERDPSFLEDYLSGLVAFQEAIRRDEDWPADPTPECCRALQDDASDVEAGPVGDLPAQAAYWHKDRIQGKQLIKDGEVLKDRSETLFKEWFAREKCEEARVDIDGKPYRYTWRKNKASNRLLRCKKMSA